MSGGPVSRKYWKFGRLQFGYRFYIHKYATCTDRWVLQPQIIWDRK